MLKLSHIALVGIMSGHAWGGFDSETQFNKTFRVRPDEARSPIVLPDIWYGLDSALQTALDWGDVWGGRGDLVEGAIEFHLTEVSSRGDVIRKVVSRDLESLAAAAPYLVRAQ